VLALGRQQCDIERATRPGTGLDASTFGSPIHTLRLRRLDHGAELLKATAGRATTYVVYGGTNVSLAQLSADGLSQVKTQHLFSASDVNEDGIEGNRMYKRNGIYYVLDDHPGDKTYIWKSDSPWGPYEPKLLVNNVQSPVPGGGAPHQGSLVKTPEGDWYYMSFTWAYGEFYINPPSREVC
jgi:hypothetical protein